MAKYLISSTETYRCDSEAEAIQLIEEAKKSKYFDVTKYTNEYKNQKQSGEIVDEYRKVSITKSFTDIKSPDGQVDIKYGFGTFDEYSDYDETDTDNE